MYVQFLLVTSPGARLTRSKDLYSYPVERARGHALHNLVTIAMHQLDLGPQAATDWIGHWADGIARDFLQCRAHLPSWGTDIDRQVQEYVNGLAYWVRGNDDWSFESMRYFGVEGENVRQKRKIWMLSRVDTVDARSLALRDCMDDTEGLGIAAMQIRRDLEVQGGRQ